MSDITSSAIAQRPITVHIPSWVLLLPHRFSCLKARVESGPVQSRLFHWWLTPGQRVVGICLSLIHHRSVDAMDCARLRLFCNVSKPCTVPVNFLQGPCVHKVPIAT